MTRDLEKGSQLTVRDQLSDCKRVTVKKEKDGEDVKKKKKKKKKKLGRKMGLPAKYLWN